MMELQPLWAQEKNVEKQILNLDPDSPNREKTHLTKNSHQLLRMQKKKVKVQTRILDPGSLSRKVTHLARET